MKRIAQSKPSPATVLSCIALFVSLGGVSYGFATGSIGSREIADNTIRSKDVRNNNLLSRDIRNNEIRAIDIRNNTLRGRDVAPNSLTDDQIDESKLTEVPFARNATELDGQPASAYARAGQEQVHRLDQPGEPGLLPGFATHSVTDFPPGFWKDSLGVVWLQGNVARLSGSGPAPVFTLPVGYRPPGTARFVAAGPPESVDPDAPSTQVVEITPGGVVIATDSVSFDGIAFRAAP